MSDIEPTVLHQRLVTVLRRRSVQRGVFTLSSGAESDFYVDVKQTSLNGEGAWLIARLMLLRLRPEVIGIGGLTLGADPIACAVAPVAWSLGRHLHAFLVRKEAKGHGTRSYLEGRSNFAEGDKVAIVEDVTTTGGSLMLAVERARASGLDVVQCLTVVDRQEGAADLLRGHGLTLESLTHRTELLESDA